MTLDPKISSGQQLSQWLTANTHKNPSGNQVTNPLTPEAAREKIEELKQLGCVNATVQSWGQGRSIVIIPRDSISPNTNTGNTDQVTQQAITSVRSQLGTVAELETMIKSLETTPESEREQKLQGIKEFLVDSANSQYVEALPLLQFYQDWGPKFSEEDKYQLRELVENTTDALLSSLSPKKLAQLDGDDVKDFCDYLKLARSSPETEMFAKKMDDALVGAMKRESQTEYDKDNPPDSIENLKSIVKKSDLPPAKKYQQFTPPDDWSEVPMDDIVSFIENGGDVNLKDEKGITLLLVTVDRDEFNAIKYLLQAGADPTLPNPEGETPPQIAHPRLGSLILQTYLESTSHEKIKEKGPELLHAAAQVGDTEIMMRLINEFGVDPNGKNSRGETPLMTLLRSPKWLAISRLPIDKFNLNATDNEGRSLLERANEFQRKKIQRTLLSAMTDEEIKEKGPELLHAAAQVGDSEIMMHLINEFDVDPNCKNSDGETPLMTLLKSPNWFAIEDLPIEMFNLNATDNKGKTVIMHANEVHRYKIQRMIRLKQQYQLQQVGDFKGAALLDAQIRVGDIFNQVTILRNVDADQQKLAEALTALGPKESKSRLQVKVKNGRVKLLSKRILASGTFGTAELVHKLSTGEGGVIVSATVEKSAKHPDYEHMLERGVEILNILSDHGKIKGEIPGIVSTKKIKTRDGKVVVVMKFYREGQLTNENVNKMNKDQIKGVGP